LKHLFCRGSARRGSRDAPRAPMNVASMNVVCFLGAFAVVGGLPGAALAGNGANFVLYNAHTEEAGVTEINGFSDFSRAFKDAPHYSAQLLEIEHAFTDKFIAALYFEGDAIQGEDGYKFGSFRAEARYRLFEKDQVFFNPVLYVEYEHMTTSHKYQLDVLGRSDTPLVEQTENSIETKLIVGRDLTDRLDVAFNWINEGNMGTGHWEFGYAAGLNYKIFEDESGEKEEKKGKKGLKDKEFGGHPKGWGVKEVKLGAEIYGGLGDAARGLTMDPRVTQQYAGLNFKTEFQNGFHVMMGGALGLTGESDQAKFRLQVGYEFE
jgi:hypothetical protein